MTKQQPYEDMRHKLDSDMLQSSSLKVEPERRGFINRTFTSIHNAYREKRINHSEYVKLINRLAAFKQGEYNDYIDMLAGAASMGMLELVIQGEVSQLEPDAARKRSQAITDITGVKPIEPEQ